jgi:hypothetical protein
MVSGTLTWLCLLTSVGTLPPDVSAMNQRNFGIPILIKVPRNQIQQLLLYSSTDEGRTWQQVASATPDKEMFPFYAPSDGLYWFSVCIVDSQGRRDPPDIHQTPPGQKILVDSIKPVLRIVSAARQGEDVEVRWDMQEEYPDLTALKLEYRPADAPSAPWTLAPLAPAKTGVTRFRANTPGALSLRMQVQDLAGNVGTVEGNVPAAAGNVTTALAPPAPEPGAPPSGPIATTASIVPAPSSPAWERPTPGQPAPMARSEPTGIQERIVPADVAPNFPAAHGNGIEPPGRPIATSEARGGVVPAAAVQATRTPQGTLPPAKVINTTHVTLDYQVSKLGPSGVGQVRLYLSTDDGQSWPDHIDDTDLKPPITIDLRGEGTYGLSLVVLSRAGLGKLPPKPGDAPQMRLEVDTTPPLVELWPPQPDPGRRNGLRVTWKVTDKNLEKNPVSLEYAERADGEWKPIAANLPGSGQHSWQLHEGMPDRVFLRAVARDAAGNVGIAATREAVLIDLSEPEGVLTGVLLQPKPQ